MEKTRGRRGRRISLGIGAAAGLALMVGAIVPAGAAGLLPAVTTPPITSPPVTIPEVPVTTPPVTTPPATLPTVQTPALPVPLPQTDPVIPSQVGSALGRQLTAFPSHGKPGTVVDLVGIGFDTGRRVKVVYMINARYKRRLCVVKVRSDGQLRCRVSIPIPPGSGAPGEHTIIAKVLPNDGTPVATTTFTLDP